jgi:hypothetical protein
VQCHCRRQGCKVFASALQLRGAHDSRALTCGAAVTVNVSVKMPQLLAALVRAGLLQLLLDVPDARLCAAQELQVGYGQRWRPKTSLDARLSRLRHPSPP